MNYPKLSGMRQKYCSKLMVSVGLEFRQGMCFVPLGLSGASAGKICTETGDWNRLEVSLLMHLLSELGCIEGWAHLEVIFLKCLYMTLCVAWASLGIAANLCMECPKRNWSGKEDFQESQSHGLPFPLNSIS